MLKGAAATSGLVLGFHVGYRKVPFAEAAETPAFAPNAFVSIDETGLVTVVASRSEMGTGIKTDLPLVGFLLTQNRTPRSPIRKLESRLSGRACRRRGSSKGRTIPLPCGPPKET